MPANLTTVPTPAYAAGMFGNAVNTTGGYLTYPDASYFRSSTYTIEFWVKVSSTSGYQIVFGRAGNEWFGINNGKATMSGGGAPTSTTSVGDGAWHHLAYTVNGAVLNMWVDGTLQGTVSNFAAGSGSTTWPASGAGSAIAVGRWASNGAAPSWSFPFNGQIDELRFSKTIRYTAAFTPPTGAFTSDADTLALYHFEADGTDSSAVTTPALSSTASPAITGTPNPGQVLSCSTGTWNATPDSYTYQWRRAGTAISGETAATYTAVSGDVGQAITCVVTAAKAGYTSGSATSNSVTVTDPTTTLTNTAAPTITGTAQVGQTLTASTGTWTPTPDSYSYQWNRSGTAISGATASTYPLVAADQGATITVTVTATKTGYNTASATSAATSAVAAAPPGAIAPNDANLVYSPHNWNVTASAAQTICSGAYLRAVIAGSATSIVANFDTSVATAGSRGLAIRVDNEPVSVVALAATVTITLPSNNWAKHTVEIIVTRLQGGTKWADPPTNAVRFTGFTVAPNSAATTTNRRAPYSVLCYGDSILEGYGTYQNGVNDARLGWGFPLRALLGAEVGVVGFNATGLTKSGEGGVPAVGDSYNLQWPGTARSFTSPSEPHLILVNIGTNDSGDITTTATALLNGLLAATTTSKIAVVQQWNGTAHKSQWQAAIATCTAPARVTYVDTTGWLNTADTSDTTHPYGYIHTTDLSPRLAAALLPLLTGAATPRRFLNKAGTAVPIG